MDFRGGKKVSWMLMTLLPLVFITSVHGKHKKVITTLSSVEATAAKKGTISESPNNVTREKNSNDTEDYVMDYYAYPDGLYLNDSYNDTYDSRGYQYPSYYYDYPGYYGYYYAYPEWDAYYDEMDSNSTKDAISTPRPTEKAGKRTNKKKPKRKTRSVPEDSSSRHLCMANLFNVKNYIFECKDKAVHYFACLNSNGFIKPCYILKDEEDPDVPLCIKKESVPYVTTCNSPEPQSFCFAEPAEKNRIVMCDDQKRRVCFSDGLAICSNQEKKRVPRAADDSKGKKNRPDVNCKDCEVAIKMIVYEDDENATPKVDIKVSD